MRIGLISLTAIGAVALFSLPLPHRARQTLSGVLYTLSMATPLVLAFALYWWAQHGPHPPGRNSQRLPILAAVLGFLITTVPLPLDRSPSLLAHGAKVFDLLPLPLPVRYVTEDIQGFFDACNSRDDCGPTLLGTRRRCAADTDGERMCVEVLPGMGCCPTEAGCAEGWVCVRLEGPSRDSRVFSGVDSSEACVPAWRTSRFEELSPAPSCVRPRSFQDRGSDE